MAEIAIVGGGPAGLACAIALAQRGIAVDIFEPKTMPIDKPCGEGIMPEGVEELKRLGVFDYLDRTDSSFFTGVCLINESGHRAYSDFGKHHGLGCRRLALSQALYHRCLDFPLIQIRHHKILGMKVLKNRVSLMVADDKEIHARIVIGADGLRSRVRSWANMQGESAERKRYGLRKHFAIRPWAHHVEVYFKPGIEAYITPCGLKQTNVTFLWSKDLINAPDEGFSFDSLLEYFPELKKRLRGHQGISIQMAIGPLHQKCRHVVADGVALIGDASGYYDAITGEGISIALRQANALARVLERILARTRKLIITKEQLLPYADEHRAITRAYYRNTSLLLWFARRPRLMHTIIRLGSAQPWTFSRIIEASRGR